VLEREGAEGQDVGRVQQDPLIPPTGGCSNISATDASPCSVLADSAVDATNWRSERAVGPAVANRKVCGGNRTWNAARTQQILITLFRTAYQQGADAIALLTDLLRSPADSPPSLCPSPATPGRRR
jgi:hypothetical protein